MFSEIVKSSQEGAEYCRSSCDGHLNLGYGERVAPLARPGPGLTLPGVVEPLEAAVEVGHRPEDAGLAPLGDEQAADHRHVEMGGEAGAELSTAVRGELAYQLSDRAASPARPGTWDAWCRIEEI